MSPIVRGASAPIWSRHVGQRNLKQFVVVLLVYNYGFLHMEFVVKSTDVEKATQMLNDVIVHVSARVEVSDVVDDGKDFRFVAGQGMQLGGFPLGKRHAGFNAV